MTITCFELRAALDGLRITQTQLALLCGVEKQQAWRWCNGWNPVPRYVWVMLSMIKSGQPRAVLSGRLERWQIGKRHVYRNGETFKMLAKRWHPDTAKRDTNAEMEVVLRFRSA